MLAKVKFSALAEADIDDIWDYFSKSGNDVADRVIDEFNEKFKLLAQNPRIGKNQDKTLIDLRSFPHKKFVIFYFPTENGVEIYRVVHSSRDIESIFSDYFEDLGE